jgi:ADP-ribosylation factor GTPase-activating protein 2/3
MLDLGGSSVGRFDLPPSAPILSMPPTSAVSPPAPAVQSEELRGKLNVSPPASALSGEAAAPAVVLTGKSPTRPTVVKKPLRKLGAKKLGATKLGDAGAMKDMDATAAQSASILTDTQGTPQKRQEEADRLLALRLQSEEQASAGRPNPSPSLYRTGSNGNGMMQPSPSSRYGSASAQPSGAGRVLDYSAGTSYGGGHNASSSFDANKFKNAKAIGSDMLHEMQLADDPNERARREMQVAAFDGATGIGSDQYFGRESSPQTEGGGDLGDIMWKVEKDMKKAAERLKHMSVYIPSWPLGCSRLRSLI